MSRFTLSNSTVVDEVIQRHLNKFVSFVLDQLGIENTYSVVLGGSFARGEGSAKVIEDGIFPQVDFDIFIFSRRKIRNKESIVERIQNRCNESKKNGKNNPIWLINVHLYSVNELNQIGFLNKFMPVVAYHDLKHAPITTLYGENIRRILPSYEGYLPKFEGLRLLINRMVCSVESLPIAETILRKKIEKDVKASFVADAARIYITACKSLCLLVGKYDASIQKTMQTIRELFSLKSPEGNLRLKQVKDRFPDIEKKISRYIEFKLSFANEKEIMHTFGFNEWLEAVQLLLYIIERYEDELGVNHDQFYKFLIKNETQPYLRYFLTHKYNLQVSRRILDIANYFIQRVLSIIWFCKLYKRTKSFQFRLFMSKGDPRMKLYASILLAFQAINKGGMIDRNRFGKAWTSLRDVYPITAKFVNVDIEQEFREYLGSFVKAAQFYFPGLLERKNSVRFSP